jgi:predicted nucleic acid-binding protein
VIYFDTSYLVRLYYQDPGAAAVRALAATDHVACAAHGQAEMIAAFHRKLRERAIRAISYAALIGQVQAHIDAGAFHWIPQSADILSRIRKVFENLPANVFLRAAHAVHLATAAESGFREVYSSDAHLLAAAKHFGLQGKNVI